MLFQQFCFAISLTVAGKKLLKKRVVCYDNNNKKVSNKKVPLNSFSNNVRFNSNELVRFILYWTQFQHQELSTMPSCQSACYLTRREAKSIMPCARARAAEETRSEASFPNARPLLLTAAQKFSSPSLQFLYIPVTSGYIFCSK